ncbi:hypothetical protein FSO04_39925 [Paraburkholderia madseniana]|uniref:Uncharacterized protein n=1 Tax=Paraburkholderia madseniana TaxID=2599607 RepID=A0A6N6W3G4_9BURK|nr:hypothetical protein FSO04_39925 [Paraburkholderia madseniana]
MWRVKPLAGRWQRARRAACCHKCARAQRAVADEQAVQRAATNTRVAQTVHPPMSAARMRQASCA